MSDMTELAKHAHPAPQLTFSEFSAINKARGERWHQGNLAMWSVSDWLMAMAGEAGEACNAGKKLRRIEEKISNLSADPYRQLTDVEQALDTIAEELADTVIYCDLACSRIGRSLVKAIIMKFNETSERYHFPEMLDYDS